MMVLLLACGGGGGGASASSSPAPSPGLPLITSVSAAPSDISQGQSTQLSWTVSGATSLSIDHGVGTVTGTSVTVSPAATTTYTLTATNGAGSVMAQATVTVTPPPAVTSFAASPAVINQGQSTLLSWVVSGATSLSIDHGVGTVSGTSVTLSPATTTTYTLTATNGAGSITAQATVTVAPPPVITSFTASPSAINQGQSTQLSWVVSGATSLSIDHGVGSVSGTSITVSPASTMTYTLTATNGAGSVMAQASVTVTPPPVITAFSASPAAINQGQSTQLSWTVNGAASLSIDHGVGAVSGTTVTVSPATTTTYALTATNGAGSVMAQATVTVTPPPAVTAFAASPPAINQGQSTLLSWVVSGATSLAIDHGVGMVSGTSVAVSPAATTTYTLTATNGAGSTTATASVTVTVAPPAGLSYAQSPVVYTKGVGIPATHPTCGGGPVATYEVAPGLPAGLQLDPLNGVLTGTPATLSTRTDYVVTASNAGGSLQTLLTITVNDVPPSIGYGSGSFLFTTGITIVTLAPQNSGGAVVSWSINPQLPAGLIFSTTDGGISGTPSNVAAITGYTVTATNSGGSCLVVPMIAVNPPAPVMTVQPVPCTVEMGTTAGFSVTATGTGVLTYQWQKDGTPIAGAATASYTTPTTLLSDNGAGYGVLVSDAYGGSVSSSLATLTVLPDLPTWLGSHPNVAAAIRWQFQPANLSNSYQAPADTDKVAWANWTAQQQADLNHAYLDAKAWFAQGSHQVSMDPAGLTDAPANQHPQINNDSLSPMEWVTQAYMWKLYIAHVAFSLAQEIAYPLPWSIANDTDETLRYLFDSSVMAWYLPNGNYGMGTYAGANFPPLRANTRPQTTFAPPMWTYPWLQQAGLIGTTRQETIGRVMDWMRGNMWHFFGTETFGTYNAVWQYRGYVPLSRIVGGTIDANNPSYGVEHWTAGCHGSVGFLHAVLRVLNIPVQPVWVCGHELAFFTSEKLYLDHGDDPYNAVVRAAPNSPILNLLIDEATYQAWFTSDLTVNITDYSSPALANVGRSAAQFH